MYLPFSPFYINRWDIVMIEYCIDLFCMLACNYSNPIHSNVFCLIISILSKCSLTFRLNSLYIVGGGLGWGG